jgi:flagellar biosynthesis protein FliP
MYSFCSKIVEQRYTFLVLIVAVVIPLTCYADVNLPQISLNVGLNQQQETLSSGLKLMVFLTALALLPTLLLTATCFTRVVVVLSMTRTALGVQQAPPNMVITGLALFLTMAIMQPVFTKVYFEGVEPYLNGSMEETEAFKKGTAPLLSFLLSNTREKDIALFVEVTRSKQPEDSSDVSLLVAIPAFVVSELNIAFQIGFLVALPFLVLDMVVASVLTSMSMITLPPVVISLPLKLMMFVMVDGWSLLISSLIKTYTVS